MADPTLPAGFQLVTPSAPAPQPPAGFQLVGDHAAVAQNGDVLLQGFQGLGDAAVGALKQPGRLVQMVPGVTQATDWLFGLPKGASSQAMEPSSSAQKVGGYVAEGAEALAGANATVADPLAYPGATSAAEKLGKGAETAQRISVHAARAAAGELIGDGPVTEAKIGKAVGKYGVAAAKVALAGLIGGAAATKMWNAWSAVK